MLVLLIVRSMHMDELIKKAILTFRLISIKFCKYVT